MKPQLLGFTILRLLLRTMHVRSILYGDFRAKQLNETYRAERDSYKLDLSFPMGV